MKVLEQGTTTRQVRCNSCNSLLEIDIKDDIVKDFPIGLPHVVCPICDKSVYLLEKNEEEYETKTIDEVTPYYSKKTIDEVLDKTIKTLKEDYGYNIDELSVFKKEFKNALQFLYSEVEYPGEYIKLPFKIGNVDIETPRDIDIFNASYDLLKSKGGKYNENK